jgi:hypothetical protein
MQSMGIDLGRRCLTGCWADFGLHGVCSPATRSVHRPEEPFPLSEASQRMPVMTLLSGAFQNFVNNRA